VTLHRHQIAGFATGTGGRSRAVAGLSVQFEDGTTELLPDALLQYLMESVHVARRAGSVSPVAGDGETVSASEAARLLGVSRPTVYAWLKQGKLDEQRDTHDHRIYTESIDRVLHQREVHAAMSRLDGSRASKVAVLSGMSGDELDELGGLS
jgi:excisionase family DNA binding protein